MGRYRGRSRGRYGYRARGGYVRKAVRKAKRTMFVRAVKKIVRRDEELKCKVQFDFTTGVNIDAIVNGQMLVCGEAIANGTGPGERVGSDIRVKSAHLRFTITPTTDVGTSSYNTFRVIAFSPKSRMPVSGNELPSMWPLGDVSTAHSTQTILAQQADRDSFYVYYDRAWVHKNRVGEAATTGDSAYLAEPISKSIHLKINRRYNYNDPAINGGLTSAVLTDWPVFIGIISDSGSSPHPLMYYELRTYYTDA